MTDHADLTFDGESDNTAFGGDDIEVRDINNDGYGEIAIAAYGYPNYIGNGRVYVYRGGTKAEMDDECDRTITFAGKINLAQFMTIGDFNCDGYGDLVVGGWGYPNNVRQGQVWLYYGGPPGSSTQLTLD